MTIAIYKITVDTIGLQEFTEEQVKDMNAAVCTACSMIEDAIKGHRSVSYKETLLP